MSAHYPGRPAIDAYGSGGFRFAGMSHQGSILILPSGVYGWDNSDFSPVFTEKDEIEFLLLGTGKDMLRPSKQVRDAIAARGLALDYMSTGSAVRTWNVLLAEGRRVAAALVAVEEAW